VYESVSGTTRKVAQAISDGAREAHSHALSSVLLSGGLQRS
jgi:hypothetical protein